ncbi:MAG: hypothetical protein CUN55_11680 [Phototrophicales bacterium]|nr:MAG: hypothetical protein CUN55_11680 [Phototrophicales bacterium]
MSKAKITVVYINYMPIPLPAADVMHTMKMCQAYQQIGCDVHLVAPKGNFRSLDALWEQYGIRNSFKVHLYKDSQRLRRHPVFLRGIFLAKRQKQPTFIHTRSSAAALYGALFGISSVYETHRPLASGMEKIYLRLGARLPHFKKIIAVTEPIQQSYQRFLPAMTEKIIVMNNGVDLEQFEPNDTSSESRAKLNLEERFTVGYIGSLFVGRGIEIILELAQRLSHIQFLVVGGTQEDVIYWKSQVEQFPPNLIIRNAVPNQELPTYMLAADLLLMPYQRQVGVYGSRTANSVDYMNPMKMYEYMAARRMIIASDLPMIRAVLNDDMAILCTPDSVDAWYEAIQYAFQSEEERQKRVQNAYHYVQNHTWQHRVQRILNEIFPQTKA